MILNNEEVKNLFYKHLDTVSVESPDYSTLKYDEIKAWGKVWELIKYRLPSDVLCIKNQDESDYRYWSWDVYVRTGTFKRASVMFTDEITDTPSILDVEYFERDGLIYCYYKPKNVYFSTLPNRIIKEL